LLSHHTKEGLPVHRVRHHLALRFAELWVAD
jgi:hypothetical protein